MNVNYFLCSVLVPHLKHRVRQNGPYNHLFNRELPLLYQSKGFIWKSQHSLCGNKSVCKPRLVFPVCSLVFVTFFVRDQAVINPLPLVIHVFSCRDYHNFSAMRF